MSGLPSGLQCVVDVEGGAFIFFSFSLSPQMCGVYSAPCTSEGSESSVAAVPLDIADWSPVCWVRAGRLGPKAGELPVIILIVFYYYYSLFTNATILIVNSIHMYLIIIL